MDYPIDVKSLIIQDLLSEIQIIFDDYQKLCFQEKPSQFFCLELNGEAGELANIEKKQWKGISIEHERFQDEAADVFIALMNYANSKNINLGNAVFEKLIKIEQKRKELAENGVKY